MNVNGRTYTRIGILALVSSLISVMVNSLGQIYGWGFNSVCSKYFGCVNGFFGYDSFEHLISGFAIICLLVWFFKTYPRYSILHNEQWKNILVLFASAALIAVAWELMEWGHDAFRLQVLQEPLLNLKLHVNLLDQPSNFDTMGDFAFGMLGSAIALFFVW